MHFEERDNRFRSILAFSGMPQAQYAHWLNRTLVAGPFQSQVQLSLRVHGWLNDPPSATAWLK